jgi:hypothetical protein
MEHPEASTLIKYEFQLGSIKDNRMYSAKQSEANL